LFAHISWTDLARRQTAAAAGRLAIVQSAVGRHEDAKEALTLLDTAVRSAFAPWAMFGSEGARPDDRIAERERLRGVVIRDPGRFRDRSNGSVRT
jgi:hypothetical protein